jgi:hypothetical protein
VLEGHIFDGYCQKLHARAFISTRAQLYKVLNNGKNMKEKSIGCGAIPNSQ